MLLPLKSCVFSAKNNQVQRPNILCWTFTLRTSVADVICAGKIKTLSFLIILFLAASPVLKAESLKLTLEEVVALGLKNSTAIQSKVLGIGAAEADLAAAKSAYYPNITAGAAWTHMFEEIEPSNFKYISGSDPLSLSLSLNQTLYAAGQIKNSVHLTEEALNISREKLQEEKRKLIILVERAFYGYILAVKSVEINKETQQNKIETLGVTRKKYEAGIASDFEVLQAEADVESFRPTVIGARNQVKFALLSVKNLLGLEGEEELDVELIGSLEPDTLTLDKETLLALALSNKFDLKSLTSAIILAEIQAELAKSANKPGIAAFLSYSVQSGVDPATGDNRYWGEDSWDGTLTGGFRIQLPVSAWFPWSGERAERLKSGINVEDLKLNLSSLESAVRLNIENNLLKIEEEKQKIASGEKSVDLAGRLYDSAVEQYARGLISSLELKDAQLGSNSAQLGYLQMIFNYKMAFIDLKEAVGVSRF
ncbi:MAG TPA: TolC family protein [Spirochaetales bacterium]|nr:TolC family protein [Spirochaetales bacterium]